MPPKITDKYRLMMFHANKDIPPFATSIAHFVEMWDDADYSAFDKRSIYEVVLLVLLRKVSSISDQEQLEPVMMEMALVKFLEIWLQWGTATSNKPGKFQRGPNKKTATDPADIAMFGTNSVFLQSITAIPDDEAMISLNDLYDLHGEILLILIFQTLPKIGIRILFLLR
jgi:hypothetical protein